jgi:hypothetical protein
MLHRPEGAERLHAAAADPSRRTAPMHRVVLERRRSNRLLSAWKTARGELSFPSFAALEAAADSELMRHSMLLRVGQKGALTIERFGPPAPAGASASSAKKGADAPPVVTPLVVTWILSVGAAALRRRAPVSESGEVGIGKRKLLYRCAVVPLAADGAEVDSLLAVLGYRWA